MSRARQALCAGAVAPGRIPLARGGGADGGRVCRDDATQPRRGDCLRKAGHPSPKVGRGRGWGEYGSPEVFQEVGIRQIGSEWLFYCLLCTAYCPQPTAYSHSIVPGGFDVTSSTTRLMPLTSLMIRVAVRARKS